MGIRITSPVKEFILMDEKLPWTRWNRKPAQTGFLTKGSPTEIWQNNKITDIKNNTQTTYNWGTGYTDMSHSAGLPGVGFIMDTNKTRIKNINNYTAPTNPSYDITGQGYGSFVGLWAYSKDLCIAISKSGGTGYVHLWNGSVWSYKKSFTISSAQNAFAGKWLDSDKFYFFSLTTGSSNADNNLWLYSVSANTMTNLGSTIYPDLTGNIYVVPMSTNRVYVSLKTSNESVFIYYNGSTISLVPNKPTGLLANQHHAIMKKDDTNLFVVARTYTSVGTLSEFTHFRVYSLNTNNHTWTLITDIYHNIQNAYYGSHPSGYDTGIGFIGKCYYKVYDIPGVTVFENYFITYDNGSQISNYDKWAR